MRRHCWVPASVALCLLLALCSLPAATAQPDTRPTRRNDVVLDFAKSPALVKARVGQNKLERIFAGHRQNFRDVEEMVALIAKDDDLGVDLANEKLIYECKGIIPPQGVDVAAVQAQAAAEASAAVPAWQEVAPEQAAAKLAQLQSSSAAAAYSLDPAAYPTAASLDAAAYPTAASLDDPAAAATTLQAPVVDAAVTTSVPGHHHHHHHRHHRRSLLQSSQEWLMSAWHPATADKVLTVTETFTLHSRPGATRKIFLDFDGHTATGTAWNDATRPSIVTPAFDKDGDRTTFNEQERSDILAIWRAVAEDYSAWDVDVTTEDPGASYPLANYVRAAIGPRPDGDSAFISGAGGVAYVGVFGESNHYYQPAYIFTESLSNSAKNIWEATSHEIGHNLNLNHDGTTTQGYYGGAYGWAPIMGVGYYQGTSQWSKGDYPNANNKEDDLAIIKGYLPLIPQSQGTSNATATELVGTLAADGITVSAETLSIIKNGSDFDWMFFNARAGPATFEAQVLAPAGTTQRTNLYMAVLVYAPDGTYLAGYAGYGVPSFTVNLATAGRHVVLAYNYPRGAGNWTTAGDFDDYGSIGQYKLQTSYQRLDQVTPSPSPSPKPSPAPSPKPSPSPSPKPSPSPSPSPSPPPVAVQMTINSAVTRKTITSSRVTCAAEFTVVHSVTGAPVSGATVTGRWSSVTSSTGWPLATRTVVTSDTGVASFASCTGTCTSTTGTLATTSGQGCIFTISALTKTGNTVATGWTKVARNQW